MLRKDRGLQQGGGVAFLLRKEYSPKILSTADCTSFEHLANQYLQHQTARALS